MNKLALAAVLLAAPIAARADVGLRLGAEAQLAHHDDKTGTSVITDHVPLAANAMLSYWLPGSFLSFDAEVSEGFYLNAPTGVDARRGTVLRPGITLSPPILPIYIRGAIPLQLEPGDFAGGLRVGAGLNMGFSFAKLYVEADADFPLFGGGTGAPSAFSSQEISLGAGLAFQF